MKKLDKLIITAFLGPFFLTLVVVVFIFLTQYLLKYLEDFVGKDLGFAVFSELIFYFSLNMVPVSLPLAVLLSSLMTFGNLGEHFELTAIKSSGISVIRTFMPIFIIVCGLVVVAFMFNNYVVPKANLKAYSLLYDIRQKKPSLDFKEGSFYNGLPGYSVKINKKFPNEKSIKGIMIYNHTQGRGNTDLIIADSGVMQTIDKGRFLSLELFNGKHFSDYAEGGKDANDRYLRNEFAITKLMFSLESFDFQRTRLELFENNRKMMSVEKLDKMMDSLNTRNRTMQNAFVESSKPFYAFHNVDSLEKTNNEPVPSSIYGKLTPSEKVVALNRAANHARSMRNFTRSHLEQLKNLEREKNMYAIEFYQKFTQSFACLMMFLIGAPLGAIIRKGGFGLPVLISIIFFIIYYVVTIMGEKYVKEDIVPTALGMWGANLMLLPIGLFFLNQARNDSRILEFDTYKMLFQRLGEKFGKKKKELAEN